MSDELRSGITERQAEARRQNGKKSRGPVTGAGKQRSSENSTKHGVWSRTFQALNRGPLREDSNELRLFVEGYIRELDPGDQPILLQMALDVADKAWKVTRAQRWEAQGYSRPENLSELASRAGWILQLASEDRKGAAVVRKLPDPSILSDDLWNPYCRLAFHFGATEESLVPLEDADAPTRMKALLSLINQRFQTTEDAAAILESLAEKREIEAEEIYKWVRPEVVRKELDGAFSRNAERVTTHTSRELDRSLKRYWQLWDRIRNTQATSSSPAHSVHQEGPRSETPVISHPPKSEISEQINEIATRASTGDKPLDLKLFESLLDQIHSDQGIALALTIERSAEGDIRFDRLDRPDRGKGRLKVLATARCRTSLSSGTCESPAWRERKDNEPSQATLAMVSLRFTPRSSRRQERPGTASYGRPFLRSRTRAQAKKKNPVRVRPDLHSCSRSERAVDVGPPCV